MTTYDNWKCRSPDDDMPNTHEEEEGEPMPVHEHGCGRCQFIAADVPASGEPRCNQVDVYHCHGPTYTTIIRRYGSDGSNYGAWPCDVTPLPERYRRFAPTS